MKQITIPDWLHSKIAKENNVGLIWNGNIDCVFGETEKAYHVMMGAVNHTVYTWIPKSQCTWVECNSENHETKIFNSFEEAKEYRDYLRSLFC